MEVKELKLSCWEDFEAAITSLAEEINKLRSVKGMQVRSPLFRGHVNSSWKLETTLERYTTKQYAMRDYFHVMRGVRPAVESFVERSWNLSEEYNIDETIPGPPLGYEFMIYLRHHGFPSPLLDWTHSAYVAAFFAFQPKVAPEDSNIAIYSYVAYSWTEIMQRFDKARIELLGPYVTTHRRHHTQQSWYTICRKRVDERWVYCCHEEAIQEDMGGAGFLRKYIMPRSERRKVLDKLYFMNRNLSME